MDFVVFQGKIDVFALAPLSGMKTNQQCCSFKLKNWKYCSLAENCGIRGFLVENLGFWAKIYKNCGFWPKKQQSWDHEV